MKRVAHGEPVSLTEHGGHGFKDEVYSPQVLGSGCYLNSLLSGLDECSSASS